MGAKRAEQVVDIAAPPQAVFEAIMDFDTYPEWQTAVKRTEVRERDEAGRPAVVETVADAKVKEVRYVLRYHYDEPTRVWWDFIEGDVRDVGGEWLLEELDGDRTRAHYRLEIDPGRFLPGPLRRILEGQVMRTVVEEVRERVEG